MTPGTEAGLTPPIGEAFQPVIFFREGLVKEEKKKKIPQIICLFHLLSCLVNTKQGLSQAEGWHTLKQHCKDISQSPSPLKRQHFRPFNSH